MPRTEDKEVKKYKAEEIEEYKGSGYGSRLLMKDVMAETDKLEERQAEIEEKGANKSLWSSIGSFVGAGLAVATGPVGWLATGAVAAGGAYVGSHVGRWGADAVKGKLGNMKRLEGSLMSKSKDSQAAGVVAMNKDFEKDAQKGAIISGVGAGWLSGGGQAAGAKLSEWGVSDKLAKADIFTKWGGEAGTKAGSLRNPWGTTKGGVTVKSVSKGASVKDVAKFSGSEAGGYYPDPKQVNLPLADPPKNLTPVTKQAKTVASSTYKGTASQNNWLSSVTKTKSGKLVDTMKASNQDSSLFSRGGLFDRLNEKGAFEIWMREKGLLS